MAIYNPEPFLSKSDRELLRLLAALILEQELGWTGNKSSTHTEITDAEGEHLIELLEQFVGSKRFQESAYLIESIFSPSAYDDRRLRDIFLSGRTFHGRTRTLATVQWLDFLMRLGAMDSGSQGDIRYWYRASARPMPLEHFLRMEAKLADSAGLHPRVKALLLNYVRGKSAYVADVRTGAAHLHAGEVVGKPIGILGDLRHSKSDRLGHKPIRITKIAAVMTIVMDVSVLYTTRDWSVAGFLSTIAGAAPPAALD